MKDKEKRELLYSLLGDLPPKDRTVSCRKIGEQVTDIYIIEKLILDLNGEEPVPAIFTKPRKALKKMPVILYNHAHGGDYTKGKNELLEGRPAIRDPYAGYLAEMGIGALCIDAWGFGERRGRTESEIFKEMLWNGRVMWGMMVYDSIKALDYLETREDIDTGRIGTIGLSMGSTMAWWLAALDERVKVCIDLCCLTDFHTLVGTKGLDLHGVYYFVPGLLKHFSTSEINALIAPRPHLSLAGIYDPLTPPAGLDIIDSHVTEVYTRMRVPEAWKLLRFPNGHFETAEMRYHITEFLKKWL